ncbi:MAG: DNA-binding transcriptional regulator [Isosphaeraceae bacterium]|nr:DNA-binding transcriptional regulator [Isosphaeraceae bacterium]
MARIPHVALMIETSSVYGRRLLEGITRYLRTHRSWSLFLEQRELDSVPPRWLGTWRGDGIISRWSSPSVVALLREAELAVIDVSDRRPPFGLVRIRNDDRAIGVLAAEHLLERGFRSFAYCGFKGEYWAIDRREAFLETLTRSGFASQVFESPWSGPGAEPWEDEQERIGTWIRSLPKPVGMLTSNDVRGFHVLDACQRFELKVPEEVAVIGVDDDSLLCELCRPSLSSIVPNPEQIGFEAAAALDRLMGGGSVDFEERVIPPLGVTTRISTDVLAVDDEHFASSVRFIRENACHGLTVEEVLERVPLSRSTLERRFRQFLGRSPQAEIRAVQLRRARQLLAETDHAMSRIAELVGFDHAEYFNVAFKREFGLTPGQFRQQAQGDRRSRGTSPSARGEAEA